MRANGAMTSGNIKHTCESNGLVATCACSSGKYGTGDCTVTDLKDCSFPMTELCPNSKYPKDCPSLDMVFIYYTGSSSNVFGIDTSKTGYYFDGRVYENQYALCAKRKETVTIKSKNYPTESFGVRDNSSELYIFADQILAFHVEVPGLSGDSDSTSFKSIEGGKYVFNHNGLLDLRALEQSVDFNRTATFRIIRNESFGGFLAFESISQPNHYIRHENFRLKVKAENESELYLDDANLFQLVTHVTANMQASNNNQAPGSLVGGVWERPVLIGVTTVLMIGMAMY